MEATVLSTASKFNLRGTPVGYNPINTGHINSTYQIICRDDEETVLYTLQKINKYNDYQASDDSAQMKGYTEGYTEGGADSHSGGRAEGYTTKEEYKNNTKNKKKETRGGQVIE